MRALIQFIVGEQNSMKRIVIRHISGARASQTDTLEFENAREILLGRDPGATVKFDPNRDDLVSRLHAKIVRLHEDPPVFSIADLKSQNGTFVNGKRVHGPVQLNPGDLIRLGDKGPELCFDLDPPPRSLPRATRVASDFKDETRTRTGADPNRTADDRASLRGAELVPSKASVGRETVLKIISQTQRETRSRMLVIGTLFGLVLLAVVGWFAYQNYIGEMLAESRIQSELAKAEKKHDETLRKIQQNQPISSAEIAGKFSGSTVLIEMSWKLIYVGTGQQVYHRWGQACMHWVVKGKRYRCAKASPTLPFYTLQSNRLEPFLTTQPDGNPIGGKGSGSGFVVSADGFILTNRHVAASWETRYPSENLPLPGILELCADLNNPDCHKFLDPQNAAVQSILSTLLDWVPTKSLAFGGKPASGKTSDGTHTYLDVVFPNSRQRIAARLVRVSDHADAALIKIDVVKPLMPIEFGDQAVRAGDPVTVLGYPGVSPDLAVKIRSEDTFNREAEWKTIPQPTVTGGNIGKVLTGDNLPEDESITDYFGQFTEAYQLTVNATGAGNSGGPVFDQRARVVGIFTASRIYGGTMITFAIPIKFGQELMGF